MEDPKWWSLPPIQGSGGWVLKYSVKAWRRTWMGTCTTCCRMKVTCWSASNVWLLLDFHSSPLPYLRVAAAAFWKSTLSLTFCLYSAAFQFHSLPGNSLGPLSAVVAAVVKSVWTFIELNSCQCSLTNQTPPAPKDPRLPEFCVPFCRQCSSSEHSRLTDICRAPTIPRAVMDQKV